MIKSFTSTKLLFHITIMNAQNLLQFWTTHPKIWFTRDGSVQQILIDHYFYYHYHHLVEQVYRDDTYLKNNQFIRILCLDQISRHIYRHLHRRQEPYQLELYIGKAYVEAGSHVSAHVSDNPLDEILWILLCIRHNNTYNDLVRVVTWIEENYSRSGYGTDPHLQYFLKFIRKTFQLYDQHPLVLTDVVYSLPMNIEYFNEILVETTNQRNKHCSDNLLSVKKIRLEIKKLVCKYKTIIVSLSGGVDSMVIMDCLLRLRAEIPSLKVIAVHICYLNRDAAKRETEFLTKWCCMHSVVLVTRTIYEYSRDSMDRELYESKTREIRYATYRRVIDGLSISSISSKSRERVPIILGHHSGDVRENVITNMLNGHSMLELGKMKKMSIHHTLLFCRPLLSLDKNHIYKYSCEFNIPYFLDTTPSWSCRGVLRTELLPTMYRQWGEHKVKTNLDHIAQMSEQWNSIIQKCILQPFLDTVIYTTNGWSFEIPDCNEMVFWIEVWGKMCHKFDAKFDAKFGPHGGIRQPSKKSIINFTNQLRTKKKMKVVLNKHITAVIGETITVLVHK